MTITDTTTRANLTEISLPSIVLILGALTIIRVVALQFSVVDLFFDEAQYWAWSQELAAGYFSKPPLLAWIIAERTPCAGQAKPASALRRRSMYFATCLGIYAIAHELYDARVAGWSALTFALGTGLVFSARIISTDVPLILCWVIALLAYVKLLRGPDWRWAIVFGLALGFGLLAKYAMIYFILCAVCAAVVDRNARAVWTHPPIMDRAGGRGGSHRSEYLLEHRERSRHAEAYRRQCHRQRFHLHAAICLRISRIAVCGGRAAGLRGLHFYLDLFPRYRRCSGGSPDARPLRSLPLALIVALSFVRQTHGNWAALAMPAMTILAIAWWLRTERWRWLAASLVLGVVAPDCAADRRCQRLSHCHSLRWGRNRMFTADAGLARTR